MMMTLYRAEGFCVEIIILTCIFRSGISNNLHCKYDQLGNEYSGNLSVTRTGKKCQAWASQQPHIHNQWDPSKFPGGSLKEEENYCRNPTHQQEGPWCYTTDADLRWEYCNIPLCDCRETEDGRNYKGKISKTKDGYHCQVWDSKTADVTSGNNYCRNPNGNKTLPWCFTTEPTVAWQFCNIPKCECKMDELGKSYSGKISHTINKMPCQRWDQQYPHKHTRNQPSKFPEKDTTAAENYCRNPDGEAAGPWCYTLDPKVRFEYCNIPYCSTAKRTNRPRKVAKVGYHKCQKSKLGLEYTGRVAVTSSGLPCQRWDQQQPHNHQETDPYMFPDNSIQDAANYCRNPDSSPLGLWCFTNISTKRWEYCDIPTCDCKMTVKGEKYKGNVSFTKNRMPCQQWNNLGSDFKQFIPADFPDNTLPEVSNHCRNPASETRPLGPWCYTGATEHDWQYCDLPLCECKKSIEGTEYLGHVNFTKSGYICQHWLAMYPHTHSRIRPDKFPDMSPSDAENYCRNPDNEPNGPWCYTLDKRKRWEYCDIDKCDLTAEPEIVPVSGLSAGTRAGVIFLALLVPVITAVVVLLWWRRRTRKILPPIHLSDAEDTEIHPRYERLKTTDGLIRGKR